MWCALGSWIFNTFIAPVAVSQDRVVRPVLLEFLADHS